MPDMHPESLQKVLALRQREAEQRRVLDQDVDSHVQEVTVARASLNQALQTYQEKVAAAQRVVRKASSGEAPKFQTFLQMQARMAGAIYQALRQAESALKTAAQRRPVDQDVSGPMNAVVDALDLIDTSLRNYDGKIQEAQRACQAASAEEALHLCLAVQTRTASSVQRALGRARSMDRLVGSAREDRREQARQVERERAEMALQTAIHDVQQSVLLPPSDDDDLEMLYPEMAHA